MKLMKKERLTWEKTIRIFLIVFGIILLFTLIDFFIHKLSNEYDVPSYYFRNKVIFGTLIGFFSYLFVRKQKLWVKSLAFSAIVSVLLQTRYYLEGYPLDFVFLFLGIHFAILLAVSWLVFKLAKKYI